MSGRITIIGTGLTGLVQALALAAQQIEVTLIGPMPTTSKDQRSTAILNPGIEFLAQLNVWDNLRDAATPLITMELIDGATTSVFDASEIDAPQFGFNIGNEALKKVLCDKINATPHITWHQTTAAEITPKADGWGAKLESTGRKVYCELLIGADGRDSLTRRSANIATTEKVVEQTALVGVLICEKPHFNTTVEWYRRGGPFTLVPVEKNKFALVWCNHATNMAQKIKHSVTEIEAELTELTEERFGKITIATALQAWPVRPMLATNMYGENCVLIGEAAHVLPPIGAQGFNLGLHDARVLAEILATAKHTGQRFNNPVLLQQYHRARHGEIATRYNAINALNTSLMSGNMILHRLRQVSLFGMSHFTFLKKQLMQIGLNQTESTTP